VESLVNFWRGKRVLLTGHTGFKGTWMALVLQRLGAEVIGIALEPEGNPNLYNLISPELKIKSHILDIRDRKKLKMCVHQHSPEIVIHMAAQALVRRSYEMPVDTFETNIMGTIYLLEALAEKNPTTLIITSDKVYRNDESGRNFKEPDALGGDDPYSASKAACEIAVNSWAKSFGLKIATARGGNVIGGGDFSLDRLLPDAFRAYAKNQPLILRNPSATRPWQHVLDIVFGYLKYAELLHNDYKNAPKSLNFGPDGKNLTVVETLEIFSAALEKKILIEISLDNKKQEKIRLELDVSLAKKLGFENSISQKDAVHLAGIWYKKFHAGEPPLQLVMNEIKNYLDSHA